MEQDSRIGIIGAGPAGCACAYFIRKFAPKISVHLIDFAPPLNTLLPTGGGRCNLANSEFDFKELAKNYPRGEKFLYSVFSQFSTSDTLTLFDEIGINTYSQEDGRIFPISNSSKEVQEKFISALKACHFIKEKALRIEPTNDKKFKVVTDMNSYKFDKLVYSTGGHNGYDIIKRLGITIVDPMPSLVGLVTEKDLSALMGTTIKNIYNKNTQQSGDILFTHFGISGPLTYKISSILAKNKTPYTLEFDLFKDLDDFQEILNKNPHKQIKNLLGEYLPHKLSEQILKEQNIDAETKCHKIDGKMRDKILEAIHKYSLKILSTKKDGETVTAGGVLLDEINPKTMESRKVPGLYFCGEVIDVDGFCGGFNLQNCWSTAFVAARAIS